MRGLVHMQDSVPQQHEHVAAQQQGHVVEQQYNHVATSNTNIMDTRHHSIMNTRQQHNLLRLKCTMHNDKLPIGALHS